MERSRARGLPPNLIGGAWLLVSAVAFTAMMTLVKFLGSDYPAAVQSVYRQLASLVMVAPLVARSGVATLKTSRPLLLTITMIFSTAGLVLSLYSYQVLRFADANALSFSRTLWLVPLAALVLRERIGWMRATAAIAGFVGIVVMLQPGTGMRLGLGELAALAAAMLAAVVIILMKTLMRDHKLTTIVAWGATVGFAISLVPAAFVWRWPTPVDLGLLAAMGALGVATQVSYVKGVSIGEAAAIVSVDYSRLIMAAALGWLLFGETLSLSTLTGAAIIILSTLVLSWHEVRTYRAAGAFVAPAD